jgi:hypothetical protein
LNALKLDPEVDKRIEAVIAESVLQLIPRVKYAGGEYKEIAIDSGNKVTVYRIVRPYKTIESLEFSFSVIEV